ncbi:hypothetical protein TNCV_3781411 [Trichonephila clavipes]|nr:hypothetical protein TNCV_3781411 [Trichonephila clavipes]
MGDNGLLHWTADVQELLESEDITRMDWLTFSPDLNPIDHVLINPCGNRTYCSTKGLWSSSMVTGAGPRAVIVEYSLIGGILSSTEPCVRVCYRP